MVQSLNEPPLALFSISKSQNDHFEFANIVPIVKIQITNHLWACSKTCQIYSATNRQDETISKTI